MASDSTPDSQSDILTQRDRQALFPSDIEPDTARIDFWMKVRMDTQTPISPIFDGCRHLRRVLITRPPTTEAQLDELWLEFKRYILDGMEPQLITRGVNLDQPNN